MSGTTKTPITVYTIMLILSTIFMFFACIFLGIEYFGRYGGTSSQPPPTPVRVFIDYPSDSSRMV